MKFKDNEFYKAFELIEKNNNFEPKRVDNDLGEKTYYYYDIEVGVALILYKLLNLYLDYNSYTKITLTFKKERTSCDMKPDVCSYDPEKILKVLKDKELKSLEEISFVDEGETYTYSKTFYIYEDKEEVKLFKSSWEDERYVDW